MPKINIIANNNGVGLTRDISIIANVLKDYSVDILPIYDNNILNKGADKLKADLNIFLELFNPNFFSLAPKNVVIPNPDWLPIQLVHFFQRIDLFLTKTKHASAIFDRYKSKNKFIGFTSYDRFLPNVSKDKNQCLHLAGKSIQKSTDLVIGMWEKHPELPLLIVIQDRSKKKIRKETKNIKYIYDRLSDEDLKVYQNSSEIHVCPSETEGFGHYIMEGLNCKGIVVTTDAPPMNELVTSERGVLCPHSRTGIMRLAVSYFVTENSLFESVKKALSLSDDDKTIIGNNARRFYEENDKAFKDNLSVTIKEIL